ncbi:multidrug effflux MFS transporter [Spongiibacter sp.]|uniref:multidrug effflux MFS transporter n=1 Tax=Spongiibacter sp. TaxID=2024860 RepID=UPI003562069B
MNSRAFSLPMTFLLASVFAMSPLAIDLYLPTIPAIARDFGVPVQQLAVTVSLYILGLSLGQFCGGPLSDYWGRRPVLFMGLAVFFAASLVLASAESLGVFWLARVLQAVGGGFASVVVPAIIRDNTEGQATAKLFALIALITIFAPAIAPALGTLLYTLSGWRAVFVALAVYGSLVLFATWRFLHIPERAAPPGPAQSLRQRYRYVLSHRVAMRYLLAQGLTFAVMMSFLVNSSVVYIEHYGQSETVFSILFAANIITLAIGNRVNNYLLNTLPAAAILYGAVILQSLACVGLLVATAFNPPLWLVVILVVLSVGALGGVMGNSQACCLHFFPQHSGIASALLGSGQYLISALISALSTRFVSEQLWPMTVTMALCSVSALLILPRPRRFAKQVELELAGG